MYRAIYDPSLVVRRVLIKTGDFVRREAQDLLFRVPEVRTPNAVLQFDYQLQQLRRMGRVISMDPSSGKVHGGIFISYRRRDTAPYAGRLRDWLSDRFGQDRVFMDVYSIKPGSDFTESITLAVGACEVLLALIGPRWITITDEAGSRDVDNPADFVRLEIETALEREIQVIPVLIEETKMPNSDELPQSLSKLTRRQALPLRHESFPQDVTRLIEAAGNIAPSADKFSRYMVTGQSIGPQSSNRQYQAEDGYEPKFKNNSLRERTLNQFTLGALSAAMLLIVGISILLQFRSMRSTNILRGVRVLTEAPIQLIIIVIPLLVVATVLTQMLSSGALRALEGFWPRRGLTGAVSRLLIQRHLSKKRATVERLHREYEKALHAAMPEMLNNGIPVEIVTALEAFMSGKATSPLTDEQSEILANTDWRLWCDAWRLGRIDDLIDEERSYPVNSRVLPTRLGNLIRATEDRLQYRGTDLQGFVLRRDVGLSRQLQMQYAQSCNRMEVYSSLFFVSTFLAILTPIILLGSGISGALITSITGGFVVLSIASYRATIGSAHGYCAILRQMDKASFALDEG